MENEFHRSQIGGGTVELIPNGYRLSIPDGDAGKYRAAQLDDYAKLARRHFPQRILRSLSLSARASAVSTPGTWGFGLWNDPFGFSLGFGGNPFRVPLLPNAIWFFHASEANYLSFRDKPPNGFLAQTFRSPHFPLIKLIKTGATLPLSRVKARRSLSQIIEEDGIALGVDPVQWHAYRFEWGEKRSSFWVDDTLVLETPVCPRPPLGLVIWIDNQYAAFTPQGKIAWGLQENAAPAWLEVEEIRLS